MKIGIVGLGLIGASFAKGTKKYTTNQVYGVDLQENVMTQALEEGAIDGILFPDELPSCDLILLAVRPGAAVEYVKAHPQLKGLVVDLCGVKRAVSAELSELAKQYGFHYIGGHPMAGREIGGYVNADADLYQGASMILVPHTTLVPEDLLGYFTALGFTTLRISEDDTHDRILAYTSQLAHIASNAFVKSPTALEHFGYSADSLKDLTRVATLDAQMWTELFLKNGDYLAWELGGLIRELEKYHVAITSGDAKALEDLLTEGTEIKAIIYPKKGGS